MPGVDDLVGTAAGWVAAVVAGYLALGFAAAIVAQRRAEVGRHAQRLLLLYPGFVRTSLRVLAVAALGIAGAPATAALAAEPAHGAKPRPPVVAPARPGVEPLDWPVAADVAPHTAVSRVRPRPTPAFVTVRTGECLWSLAARAMGPEATRGQIAAAWPRWWSANRHVIGADPDLIRPGVRLRVPTITERSAS